jgi:maleate cis-trans isomerase
MREILDEAGKRSGLPCDTDLEAHIATLNHFGARKIALVTRWPEVVNAALTRYLADAGIEVLVCQSRARTLAENKFSSPAADHDLAIELAREAMREAPKAEALLMPGGLWYAIYAVPQLEAEFGRPVLLNILSTTWAALDSVRDRMVTRPEARWGKVLASVS